MHVRLNGPTQETFFLTGGVSKWRDEDKEALLEKLHKRAFQELLRENEAVDKQSIEQEWNAAVQGCIRAQTIRDMCDEMASKISGLEVLQQVAVASGTVDYDDPAGGCWADTADQVKNACVTM